VIPITERIAIHEREIEEVVLRRRPGRTERNLDRYRSSAPLRHRALAEPRRTNARTIAHGCWPADDGDSELVISARRFRTRERNSEDAYERPIELLCRAAQPGKPRVATHPTRHPANGTEKQSSPADEPSACANSSRKKWNTSAIEWTWTRFTGSIR
jgi:ribosome-associated protein